MNAKTRAAVYAAASGLATIALIYGWIDSEQQEAWLRLADSLLNLFAVVAPLLALKHLTPDPEPEVADE